MTVKTDKLSENQVAELLNNLMIESYQLNNNGILDVFFNEDIIEYEGLDWILIYNDLAIAIRKIINRIPVLKRRTKLVRFYRKIDYNTYEPIWIPCIEEIMAM